MFTGIVESVGKVMAIRSRGGGIELEIDSGVDLTGDRIGDSIAVDGVCLTITAIRGSCFSAAVSTETVTRSTLGGLTPGAKINMERALTLASRIGGHLVLGHIDVAVPIKEKIPQGETAILRIHLPSEFRRYVVPKGSIAVDGVSLTVNRIAGDCFELQLIPHTLRYTALTLKESGDRVNLEFDILGKYVERLLDRGNVGTNWDELLRKQGFL